MAIPSIEELLRRRQMTDQMAGVAPAPDAFSRALGAPQASGDAISRELQPRPQAPSPVARPNPQMGLLPQRQEPVAQAQPARPAQQPGFFSRVGQMFQNPEAVARLAMIANSLSFQPSQGFQTAMQGMIDQRQLGRSANQTAAYLRSQGQEELAKLVEQDPANASAILSMFYKNAEKPPSAFAEKVETLVDMGVPRSEAVDRVLAGSGTTINMPSEVGPEVAKQFVEVSSNLYTQAMAAQESLASLDQTLELIDAGNANIGPFSEARQFFNNMQAFFGGDEQAIRSASDTDLLNALLGTDTFGAIKQLGIGARGMDTPGEREFLRQVLTGTTKLTEESLRRMTELRRKYAERTIKKYNEAVARGQYQLMESSLDLPAGTLYAPIPYEAYPDRPEGVEPEVWGRMTLDQKREFIRLGESQ